MPTNKKVDCNEILDSIDEYISSFDRNWNILYISKRTADDFGFSQCDLIGKNFWQMFPRFVGTELEKIYNQVMEKKIPQVFEWKTIYAKPSIREFTVSPSALGITVHGKDITERKKTEEAAKLGSTIFDLSSDSIVVADLDGNIIRFNDAACKMRGYSREEMAKLKVNDLNASESADLLKSRFKQLVEQGSAFFEAFHVRKDKSLIPVEIHASIVEWENKKLIVAIHRDITERKKAVEALRDSEKLYHTLFDNSEDGFMLLEPILDKNGKGCDFRFLELNSAYERQTGAKAVDVLGKLASEVTPELEPEIVLLSGDVAKTGKPVHNEAYNKYSSKWYDSYFFPYSKGQVGILFRDITAKKMLEQQLLDKERLAAIGATAGMVGHDIRNPLQAIVSELYLEKENISNLPDGEVKQETLESITFIQEQVDYINKIVADLQDYARNTKPTSHDVNIKDLIDSTFSALTIPSNIVAKCTVQGNPQLKSDHDYLRRIITNLSTNAIQAMPNGGKLTLNVKQNKRLVEISVSDTGNGIPKEIQDRIFTPLFTTKSKGQGFGLPVVKKFVEQLGGTITFDTQEGKGTTFKIELPITP